MARPTLIVFARAPAIGVGKTRLARDIGAVEAWRIYRAMSARLLWSLRDPRWRLVVRLAGRGWDAAWPRLAVEAQGRGDLGVRLERAIQAHVGGRVAVVGTDTPDVTRGRVWRALRLAPSAGPASDGGFWVLALTPQMVRSLRLEGVRWSSAHTLKDVERTLELTRLETLRDIDDGADLAAWRSSGRG